MKRKDAKAQRFFNALRLGVFAFYPPFLFGYRGVKCEISKEI